MGGRHPRRALEAEGFAFRQLGVFQPFIPELPASFESRVIAAVRA
jgi:hypothetical protein